MFRRPKRVALTLVALMSLATVAACGSSSGGAASTGSPSTTATAPITTEPAAPATTMPATTMPATTMPATVDSTVSAPVSVPKRIVSLAPTHTETLFAIGAGAQVVAVDDQSNYPPEALAVKTDLSGFTPNVEAIAGYKPDLVVLSDDSAGLSAQLEALKIKVWVGPAAANLDDVYAEIEQLGVLTGHVADSATLVASMRNDISSIIAMLPGTEAALTYYHELDNTYFSVTSKTFIGQLYSLANLTDIADGADANNDYPQLNSEYIIKADPDLIFLADTKCCGETPATVAARDGWSGIKAVQNGDVVPMDDDIASRWGPRVVDYFRAIVAAVDKVANQVPEG